jgi:hypothetical protein
MITLIKIAQVMLVIWLVRRLLGLCGRGRSPQPRNGTQTSQRRHTSSRFDCRGKDVQEGEFEECDTDG